MHYVDQCLRHLLFQVTNFGMAAVFAFQQFDGLDTQKVSDIDDNLFRRR